MQIGLSSQKHVFLQIFMLCFFSIAAAQNVTVDSLEQKLKKAKSNTQKLELLQELSVIYSSVNPKKKFHVAKQYKELAEKMGIDSTVANGYIDMGISFGIQSKLDSALFYFSKGYDKAVKSGYEKGIARSLVSFGFTFARLDDKKRAVEKYREGLEIYKRLKFTRGINQCYINIGSIYFDMAEYKLADKYFMASYRTYLEEKDEFGMAGAMFSLGNTQRLLGNMAKAKEFYSKSLAIREKRGELNGIALAKWGLGIIANEEKKYDEALPLLETAVRINREIKDMYQETAVLLTMSETYLAKGDFRKAESLALEALEKGKIMHSLVVKTAAYERLTKIAKKANNIHKAFDYQSHYLVVLDSMKSQKELSDIKIAEFERVQSENENLIKDNDLITAKSSNYLKTIFIISFLLVMVIFLSDLLYRRNLEKQSTNLQLKKQKQEIDAINEELKSLNEELRMQMQIIADQNEELERLNTIKNKFFSIVSHDLRSPLATLQMLFSLYRKGQLGEAEMNEMLITLEETIYMTTVFLDNLLNWSKSQLEGMVVKPSVLNIKEMVDENIRLMETQIELKNLSAENKIGQAVTAFADPNMMNVVLRNLISNSVKFCNESDSIVLDAENSGDKVIFTIKDTGPGISKKDLENLFNLEQTVSVGTSGETGHHIGLILCRDMVEMNNGRIWVESELGKGTVFYVELPNNN